MRSAMPKPILTYEVLCVGFSIPLVTDATVNSSAVLDAAIISGT